MALPDNLSNQLQKLSQNSSSALEYSLVLYDIPELYYAYLPHDRQVAFINRLITEYDIPLTNGILDLGCGGARILAELASDRIPSLKKVGVDAHGGMIAYGNKHYGERLELQVGDVRSFRYGSQFSFVICMGTVLQYARSNDELRQMVETMVTHLAPEGMLLVDIKNSATYLGGCSGLDQLLAERTLSIGEFHGVKRCRHNLDLKRQTLELFVDWDITSPINTRITDHCSFRLIFPQELLFILETAGLEVLGVWDGFECDKLQAINDDASFNGDRLIAVARWAR